MAENLRNKRVLAQEKGNFDLMIHFGTICFHRAENRRQ